VSGTHAVTASNHGILLPAVSLYQKA